MRATVRHTAVVAYLRSVGAKNVRIDHGGKHPRVVFEWQGKERYRTLSNTPTDQDAAARAAIRDLRNSLGLGKSSRTVGARRQRKGRAPDAPAAPPTLTALPDWREKLLAMKTPEEINEMADEAWRQFWRDAMRSVGGKSLL